jgi:hypothetical protein
MSELWLGVIEDADDDNDPDGLWRDEQESDEDGGYEFERDNLL